GRALVVDDRGGDERAGEPASCKRGREGLAPALRREHRDHHAEATDPEQGQRGREREPIDRRARDRGDHGLLLTYMTIGLTHCWALAPAAVKRLAVPSLTRSLIDAGQADRKSRIPTSGT